MQLKQEDRTNYVAVMKLASVWVDFISRATADYCETTFPEDDFKTYVENIVDIRHSVKGLDQKSVDFVDFLYERLKDFRDQLTLMKAYLDSDPPEIRDDCPLVAAGVFTHENLFTLLRNEKNWMHAFENEVSALYHGDYDMMRSDGLNFGALWTSIPADYYKLDNILCRAGGNTLANMIERLDTHILELENSGILSSYPLYVLK